MNKEYFFNFLWWFSSPFFIIFFFILLLLKINGIGFIYISLPVFSILVIVPLLTEWAITNFLNINKNERTVINLIFIVSGFLFSYFFYIQKLEKPFPFIFIVFGLSIIFSYLILFLKYNQYSFLLGVFISITLLLQMSLMEDLFYFIIVELIFSAILFRYFIIFKVDNLKGILLSFFGGFIACLLIAYVVNLFLI